jgi:hypothetical protein
MSQNQAGSSSPLNINNLQDAAQNLLLFLASIVSKTADMIVRPFFGTRYYAPAVDAFAFLLLLIVASVHTAAVEMTHMIPFVTGPPPPQGMFDLWWLVRISFLAQIIHRIRLFRRMMDVSREKFSWYEGPALPILKLIPGNKSFWRSRILIEPAIVFAAASVLQHLSSSNRASPPSFKCPPSRSASSSRCIGICRGRSCGMSLMRPTVRP